VGRLAVALQAVDDSLGRGLAGLLESGTLPPTESLCTVLLESFARWGRRCLLVLDDYHIVQERSVTELVETLVVKRPPQLHLVLISREDPLLPLPRLRAGRLVTELRAEDLRFTAAETQAFFNEIAGLPLGAEDVGRLENRIEGWAAGLQLAALSLRGQANPSTFIAKLSGTHRHILGYLTEEVLSRQTAEVRQFLVQTSILSRLTGGLCDAVTERTDSAAVLERLLAANLFLIPLDTDGRWYRYHHLFADLLHSHQAQYPRSQISSWHRRASEWFAGAALPAEALDHAVAAQDFPQAVKLLEQHAMAFTMQGFVKTVEGWMEAIPPDWRARSPRAYLAFASVHLLRGNYAEVTKYLNLSEPAIFPVGAPGGAPAAELRPLQAEWYAIQANLLNVQGRPTESLAAARLALQLAPVDDFTVRGTAYLGLGGAYRLTGDYLPLVDAYQKAVHFSRAAGNSLAEMLSVNAMSLMAIEHGHLRYARQIGLETLERFERLGIPPPPVAGTVYGTLGLVEYEWNHLDAARQHIAQSIHLNTLGGHNAGVIFAKVIMARLARTAGDTDEAARLLREAFDLVPHGVPVWLMPEIVGEQVRLYLALDNPDSAEAALAQYPRSALDPVTHPDEPVFIAQLRLHLYRAEAGAERDGMAVAIELADRLVAEALAHQRLGIALQALLIRAEVHSAQGNTEACGSDLAQAIQLAQPEAYVRTFVDEGPVMAHLLRNLRLPDAAHAYVATLLAAFGPDSGPSTPPGKVSPMVEPVSDRELDVLRLVAEGLTNPDIAARLVISLSTVKTHLNNIYGKLGARNRAEAVLRAKEVGLL
jgi:LuxR family maltose regulon positive regulatory protein